MTKIRHKGLRFRRMLAPAHGLRRYLFLTLLGLLTLLAGIGLCFKAIFGPLAENTLAAWNQFIGRFVANGSLDVTNYVFGGLLMALGCIGISVGISRAVLRLREGAEPTSNAGTIVAWRQKQRLAMGPRIVAIGGGTGLSMLLRGLKQYSSNITAIVTVSDDGGSSGRLVKDMGIIPPGDIRNCLVALADAEKRMTDLFQHRFKAQSGSLSGHSVGNLLIAGLIEMCNGDIDQALTMASDVLVIRGRVVPSTMDSIRLRALMEDGTEICGETAIVESNRRIRRIFLDPPDCQAHPEALEAIANADLICIGPGSVYSSVIPNFLVPGIAEAAAASKAPKAYICNVMTQRGESESFTAAEHLVALQANVETRVADYVFINTGVPSQEALEKYRGFHQEFVVPDTERVATMGYRPVIGDFINELDYVRHDPARLAERLIDLI